MILLVQVFVVDNYFTGRKRNIEQWLGHDNFEMLHHDIGQLINLVDTVVGWVSERRIMSLWT